MHVHNCYGIIGWLLCAGCGVQHTVNTNGRLESARQAGKSIVAVKLAGLDFKKHCTKKTDENIFVERQNTSSGLPFSTVAGLEIVLK